MSIKDIRASNSELQREIDTRSWDAQRIERFAAGIPRGAVEMTRAGAHYMYPEIECPTGTENDIVYVLKGIVVAEKPGKKKKGA